MRQDYCEVQDTFTKYFINYVPTGSSDSFSIAAYQYGAELNFNASYFVHFCFYANNNSVIYYYAVDYGKMETFRLLIFVRYNLYPVHSVSIPRR